VVPTRRAGSRIDAQRDVAVEKFGEDLGMIEEYMSMVERTMGEVVVENISALWRLIHLHSRSQQSPELSCQLPLSASLCTTAPSWRPMPAIGDWYFGRTAANVPHVAWYQISG